MIQNLHEARGDTKTLVLTTGEGINIGGIEVSAVRDGYDMLLKLVSPVEAIVRVTPAKDKGKARFVVFADKEVEVHCATAVR